MGLVIVGLYAQIPVSGLAAALFTCGGANPMFWAPAWEELVFRFIIFYLVLQRSHGNVPFACAASALAFAAIHMGNILAPGSQAAENTLFALLQCSFAVVCGLVYALTFAATGSLGAVTLLHALNNAIAVAWMSVIPSDAGIVCKTQWSTGFSWALVVSLCVYMATASAAYRAVGKLTVASHPPIKDKNDGRLESLASENALKGSSSLASSFAALHPLVYQIRATRVVE